MVENKQIIKVPGKLMIAGEFSVLIPHQHLIVTAVDRFVYAKIEQAEENLLSLEDFELNHLAWKYGHGEIQIETDDPRISFVKTAMEVTHVYLQEQGIKLHPFHLSVRSELDDASGRKYGLGSSAAIVSAVVSALMYHFMGKDSSKEVLFKLAAYAHTKVQGSGSGADIAASIYGGVLEYASFQAEWLLEEVEKTATLSEFIHKEWPYLFIRSVQVPNSVHFCVGWTGKPASTVKLVDKILTLRKENPIRFENFLKKSEAAVKKILAGLENNDWSSLFHGVKANRKALAEIGKAAGAPVETELLSVLSDLADTHGGAGKSSGAGGGDCGIAFMKAEADVASLFESWTEAGIKPLPIKSYPNGVTII